jgi:hypothetical protein
LKIAGDSRLSFHSIAPVCDLRKDQRRRADRSKGTIDMPKMTDREKLAELDKRQHQLAQEAETVRKGIRSRYGAMLADIPVERISEREFRDLLNHAIRAGGPAAVIALKALPAAPA